MTDLRRVRLLVEGRVQGVGFRAFVAREARTRGVAGFVRNLRDDRVEVLAQGAPDDVAGLCAACWRGPDGARVTGVDLSEDPRTAVEGDGFVIARDG